MAGPTFISDPPSEAEALDAYSRAVISVAERLAPSVANLRVSHRGRGGRTLNGGGSAVVITHDGFMLTSAHVVARPDGGGRASFVDGREVTFSTMRVADPERVGSERPRAETTPAVTEPAKPFGLPIATTS